MPWRVLAIRGRRTNIDKCDDSVHSRSPHYRQALRQSVRKGSLQQCGQCCSSVDSDMTQAVNCVQAVLRRNLLNHLSFLRCAEEHSQNRNLCQPGVQQEFREAVLSKIHESTLRHHHVPAWPHVLRVLDTQTQTLI